MAILTKRCLLILLGLMLLIPAIQATPRVAYIAASAVMPGTGELLLGANTRGATLMGIDMLSIYAFAATNKEIDLQRKSYMQYAFVYADVPLDMPLSQYQAIQDYPSSQYFNDIQEMMARNYYLIYNYDPAAYADYMARNTYTGAEEWNWQSEAHWQEYKDMRTRHQRTKMSHNFALGIMLLNRAISVIDTALLSRKGVGTVYAAPSGMDGVMLNYQVNF